MAKFVCKICGYVYEGDVAPEVCPQCKKSGVFVEQKDFLGSKMRLKIRVGRRVQPDRRRGAPKGQAGGAEILEGKISLNPCRSGTSVPCTWCPYHGVCGFDIKGGGYRYRRLASLKPADVWNLLEQKAQEKGGAKDGGKMDQRPEEGH